MAPFVIAIVVSLAIGGSSATAQVSYRDGYRAYLAGAWEAAQELFAAEIERRPDDLENHLDLGSAQYRLGELGAAAESFAAAATSAEVSVRQRALYNLGNVALQQDRLEEAEKFYRSALEIRADDDDAKFNLELTLRRLEEKREESPQSPQDQESEESTDSGSSGGEPQGSTDDSGTADDAAPTAADRDTDDDGLGDRQERDADNPTDPDNPDSDGDGVRDGDEDRNGNGRVDPGETDPNTADAPGAASGAEETSETSREPTGMTQEEAERYLQALEEHRPDRRRSGRGGPPGGKDW